MARGFVVMDLVQDAAPLGGERAMRRARRPACVGGREALLAAAPLLIVAHDQVALRDVDFFPVVVHEGLGRERARLDLEEPRTAAALVRLVEIRSEDLLIKPWRIPGRPLPTKFQVCLYRIQVFAWVSCFPNPLSPASSIPVMRRSPSPRA